jgi:WD40 repeat protein
VLWDATTGNKLVTLPGLIEFRGLAFSRDGRTLATFSLEPGVKLWDTATGEALACIGPESHPAILSFALSPDAKTLATASRGTVRLWNLAPDSARGGPTDPHPVTPTWH